MHRKLVNDYHIGKYKNVYCVCDVKRATHENVLIR